jgi:hypothetical protein
MVIAPETTNGLDFALSGLMRKEERRSLRWENQNVMKQTQRVFEQRKDHCYDTYVRH